MTKNLPETPKNTTDRNGENAPSTPDSTGNGQKPPRHPCMRAHGGSDGDLLVTTCRDGEITSELMTAVQVRALNPADVDFHRDKVFGQTTICTEAGKPLRYGGEIPGLGPVGEALLEDLMWQAGKFQPLVRLRRNPALATLSDNAFSARLKALRAVFGESAATPWYFLSQRRQFRISWSINRSWRIIEYPALPSSSSSVTA